MQKGILFKLSDTGELYARWLPSKSLKSISELQGSSSSDAQGQEHQEELAMPKARESLALENMAFLCTQEACTTTAYANPLSQPYTHPSAFVSLVDSCFSPGLDLRFCRQQHSTMILLSQLLFLAFATCKHHRGQEPLRMVTGSLLVPGFLFAEPDVVRFFPLRSIKITFS